MIQMILTLRCVGLSFEVNQAAQKQDNRSSYEKDLLHLSFLDVLCYGFNFIGLLTGPYYSYKTYLDYFRFSFGQYANCTKATIEKFLGVPMYVGVYLLAGYIWPLEYAKSEEFYEVRGVLYRLWYIFPTFLIFRMRMYAGLTLSECVCTITGMGAYPKVADNKSGAGPALEGYESLNVAPEKHEYDFETIRNMDVQGTETCVTFREGMKTWNMCVQYWLAVVVYKRFPSKQFRTLATLATSAGESPKTLNFLLLCFILVFFSNSLAWNSSWILFLYLWCPLLSPGRGLVEQTCSKGCYWSIETIS